MKIVLIVHLVCAIKMVVWQLTSVACQDSVQKVKYSRQLISMTEKATSTDLSNNVSQRFPILSSLQLPLPLPGMLYSVLLHC